MAKIKDKKIKIFEVVPSRDLRGNEVRIKRYIHSPSGLWAYARELSEREKFAAKSEGSEQSIIFRINYNKKVRSSLMLEFRSQSYQIVSIDNYEFYERDLNLRCIRAKEVAYDYEEYDQ